MNQTYGLMKGFKINTIQVRKKILPTTQKYLCMLLSNYNSLLTS